MMSLVIRCEIRRKFALMLTVVILLSAVLTGCGALRQAVGGTVNESSQPVSELESTSESESALPQAEPPAPGLTPLSGAFADNPGYKVETTAKYTIVKREQQS